MGGADDSLKNQEDVEEARDGEDEAWRTVTLSTAVERRREGCVSVPLFSTVKGPAGEDGENGGPSQSKCNGHCFRSTAVKEKVNQAAAYHHDHQLADTDNENLNYQRAVQHPIDHVLYRL